MPRVLHIIGSLGHNGLAAQLLVLSRGLVQRGFDVQVATLDRGGALIGEYPTAGVAVIETGRRWSIDPMSFWQLRRVVRRFEPEVIHTWDVDTPMLAAVVASGRRSRVVAGHYRIAPWKSTWAWGVERRLGRRVRTRIVNSAVVRDWYAANGFDANQFHVIPVGVPAAAASDVSRDELLHELKLPADARLIGVVGRLVPVKGVQDLIWAADLLRVLHDNLRVLIIGDGPQRPMLEQYARLASDLDHIRFLGERSDVWRIMPHFDVLWNADENRGQSVAVLEAMAAGVPVVASDTPFNRELVVEGETGYLIPLGERAGRATRARHTDRVFSNADLAGRLGAAATQRSCAHFSAERMIQRYVDEYSVLQSD